MDLSRAAAAMGRKGGGVWAATQTDAELSEWSARLNAKRWAGHVAKRPAAGRNLTRKQQRKLKRKKRSVPWAD